MNLKRVIRSALWAVVAVLLAASHGKADPCGMVPPAYFPDDGVPLVRIGIQKTYVFHKNEMETIVIRPGFSGKVEEFGMLIPFPTPPAIRKVPDDIFSHLAAAVDPPEIVVAPAVWDYANRAASSTAAPQDEALEVTAEEEARVIREEAVGMYDVVVLEAGSARALKRWMEDHQYRYPEGMDAACNDYVRAGWCFVAVRTRVGHKKAVDPVPGQRELNPKLPPGASFDGHVQAMGFRFPSDQLVVPMRLSTFNGDDLRNVVYLLTEQPSRIEGIPREYVVRQLAGNELHRNLTEPLPLRIVGGTLKDIPPWRRESLPAERDPSPHNGFALDLFAGDLMCAAKGRLSNPYEHTEKALLRIGERLLLRGPDIDRLHQDALKQQRDKVASQALADLKQMTLTVVDGDFPRQLLANEDLSFTSYDMPSERNAASLYNARFFGPAGVTPGLLLRGALSAEQATSDKAESEDSSTAPTSSRLFVVIVVAALLAAAGGWALVGRRRKRKRGTVNAALLLSVLMAVALCGVATVSAAWGQAERGSAPTVDSLLRQLADSQNEEKMLRQLAAMGETAVDALATAAAEAENDLVLRGWALVALGEVGGQAADRQLQLIHSDHQQHALVRTWALAARIKRASSVQQLVEMAQLAASNAALHRPLAFRIEELSGQQNEHGSLAQLLAISARVPAINAVLAPSLLAQGPSPLIEIMLTSEDQTVRRQAAGFLATLAARGNQEIAGLLTDALRYQPSAETVPWDGGPLFLPSIAWQQEEALDVVGRLLSWMLWCDRNDRQTELSQIQNNVWSLAQAAGIPVTSVDTDGLLFAWSLKAGRERLNQLLREHGDDAHMSLLDQLRIIEQINETGMLEVNGSWQEVGIVQRDGNRVQIVYLTPHSPRLEWVKSVRLVTPLAEKKAIEKASVGGKYKTLLHTVKATSDLASYGQFRDYGFWNGTSYMGRSNLTPGYWVYVYPRWYIWRDRVERAQ